MNRIVFIMLCFVLVNINSYAQHLNKIGKIEVEVIPSLKPYRIDYVAQKIYTDTLTFEGNTWYAIETGFLTSLELANNEKDKIFFDLRIIDDELFFVEKIEKRRQTVFRLYKTSDLKQFYLADKMEME